MIGVLLLGLALAADVLPEPTPPGPSTHSLIYLNARLALREQRPGDAVRLWLLRNALEEQTERVSPYDDDFNTITWVALGELGVCQDGLELDTDAAGLWPLALHNHVVRTRGRGGSGERPRPFRSFEADRQQRFISVDSVLGSEELRTVDLERGRCLGPILAILGAGGHILQPLRDREVSTPVLQHLLERARVTVDEDVRGQAVIDARLFDVHLAQIRLARIRARQELRGLARLARDLGLSRASTVVMRTDGRDFAFTDDSEPAAILRRSASWDASAWMALSPDRRRYLFDQADRYLERPESLAATRLQILDALIATGNGAETEQWIARHDDREAVWSGERGARLLALDRTSGFTERGPIALHRGVASLQAGDLDAALRSFAYAVQYAPESARSAEVGALALRWLSYVSARFELTESLLITLQELVPRQAYTAILEDLMWSAAFRADAPSYQRGLDNQLGRGAAGRRLERLGALARGDADRFVRELESSLEEAPGETLRFLGEYLERLELEDASVRRAQRPVLVRVRTLLEELADPSAGGRLYRQASGLLERSLAMLEGLGIAGQDASARDAGRRLDPDAEVFAGSVRLAPSDPLPWPFTATDASSPGIFVPLDLEPVEWRADDAWVYGWKIEG